MSSATSQTTGVPTSTVTATSPSAVSTPDSTKSGKFSSSPTYIPFKDVSKHFMTIAFSEYNGVVVRQDRPTGYSPLTVAMFGNYSEEEIATINDFIQKFNRVAKTQKLYGTVKTNDGDASDLWINLLSEKDLQNIPDSRVGYTKYESMFSDTIFFRIIPGEQVSFSRAWNQSGQVFVNKDLPREERSHYILRAMTFWLGVTGDATDEDSFFYPGNTNQTTLSESDWRAIAILYGPVVKNGMTVSEVKTRMYTSTSSS
ncbi:MAG: DUF2927 domain-containing protein [Methanoregulaceae archaeon]